MQALSAESLGLAPVRPMQKGRMVPFINAALLEGDTDSRHDAAER